MSSDSRKSRKRQFTKDVEDNLSQEPAPKKLKLSNNIPISTTFYNLLCDNAVSELLDPTNDDLDVLGDMESMLMEIIHTIRSRKQFIQHQQTLKRNKLLDSIISIDKRSIKSHIRPDWAYQDDKRSTYECKIKIGQQDIEVEAYWFDGAWECFGYVDIGNIFKCGRSPDNRESKDKMIYYNVKNGIALRENCKNISILSEFNNLSHFDWIVKILSLGFDVLDRVDEGHWMKGIFGSMEWIQDQLYTWEESCLKERNEYNAIINNWVKMNEVNVGVNMIDLIKCFACTKYGVCCGVLHEDQYVFGLNFV